MLKNKGSIPLVMIPLEVTHKNLATQEVFDYFAANQHINLSKAILEMLTYFKARYYEWERFEFPVIHDPLTIFYVLHPEEFQTKKAIIQVDTYPISYGRTNCFFINPKDPMEDLKSNDLVAVDLKNNNTRFWDVMTRLMDQIFSQKLH